MCGSRKYPYPHHRRSLEIPREGVGGSKAVISEENWGSWETTFPKGDEPRAKHWKQRTIDLKQKTYLGMLFCNKSQ